MIGTFWNNKQGAKIRLPPGKEYAMTENLNLMLLFVSLMAIFAGFFWLRLNMKIALSLILLGFALLIPNLIWFVRFVNALSVTAH